MTDFEQAASEVLRAVSAAIDESGLDCDVEPKGDGILEIELANGTKIIVNRHMAAGEIWIAAKSGGYHFRQSGNCWCDTRNGEEFFGALSRCLSEQSGEHIHLTPRLSAS